MPLAGQSITPLPPIHEFFVPLRGRAAWTIYSMIIQNDIIVQNGID